MLIRFFEIAECWKHCLRLTQMYLTYLSRWNTSFRPNTNFSDFKGLSSNGSSMSCCRVGTSRFFFFLLFLGGSFPMHKECSVMADAAPGWGLRSTSVYGNRQFGVSADSAFLWYPASAVLTVPDTRCPSE